MKDSIEDIVRRIKYKLSVEEAEGLLIGMFYGEEEGFSGEK